MRRSVASAFAVGAPSPQFDEKSPSAEPRGAGPELRSPSVVAEGWPPCADPHAGSDAAASDAAAQYAKTMRACGERCSLLINIFIAEILALSPLQRSPRGP